VEGEIMPILDYISNIIIDRKLAEGKVKIYVLAYDYPNRKRYLARALRGIEFVEIPDSNLPWATFETDACWDDGEDMVSVLTKRVEKLEAELRMERETAVWREGLRRKAQTAAGRARSLLMTMKEETDRSDRKRSTE
jgi:hypothetical protein